jgi:hypothetical protein
MDLIRWRPFGDCSPFANPARMRRARSAESSMMGSCCGSASAGARRPSAKSRSCASGRRIARCHSPRTRGARVTKPTLAKKSRPRSARAAVKGRECDGTSAPSENVRLRVRVVNFDIPGVDRLWYLHAYGGGIFFRRYRVEAGTAGDIRNRRCFAVDLKQR